MLRPSCPVHVLEYMLAIQQRDNCRQLHFCFALHWLPVQKRVDFKIVCLVFKSLSNLSPSSSISH